MELAEARALVEAKTGKDSTVRHLISVEGVMRALARRFGEDEHRWALARVVAGGSARGLLVCRCGPGSRGGA